MTPFPKPIDYVRIQAVHDPNKLQPSTCLLDTGAELKVINGKLIQGSWNHKVKSHPTPKLQNEIKERMTFLESALLQAQAERLHVEG